MKYSKLEIIRQLQSSRSVQSLEYFYSHPMPPNPNMEVLDLHTVALTHRKKHRGLTVAPPPPLSLNRLKDSALQS